MRQGGVEEGEGVWVGFCARILSWDFSFGFTEKFKALVMGKQMMAAAISPLQLDETLDIPLAELQKGTFEKVRLVWSSLWELIRN